MRQYVLIHSEILVCHYYGSTEGRLTSWTTLSTVREDFSRSHGNLVSIPLENILRPVTEDLCLTSRIEVFCPRYNCLLARDVSKERLKHGRGWGGVDVSSS